MIIGISGIIGSGKDLTGLIIQGLIVASKEKVENPNIGWLNKFHTNSDWEIKKFAGKLKQMVSLLTGIPVEDLEKQEVKDSFLGKEWCRYNTISDIIFWLSKYKSKEYALEQSRREGGVIFEFELLEFANSLGYNSGNITVRHLLQQLGTSAVRDVIHSDAWVNALFADYKAKWIPTGDSVAEEDVSLEKVYPNWIITDVRFENEAQAIKDRGGIIIRVNRDYMLSGGPEDPSKLHSSETSLNNWDFDEVIQNDGTIEELIESVKDALVRREII